jgi:hypothetical protein
LGGHTPSASRNSAASRRLRSSATVYGYTRVCSCAVAAPEVPSVPEVPPEVEVPFEALYAAGVVASVGVATSLLGVVGVVVMPSLGVVGVVVMSLGVVVGVVGDGSGAAAGPVAFVALVVFTTGGGVLSV